MTTIQSFPTATVTVSPYVIRKIVAGVFATAAVITLGFLVATQTSTVLNMLSDMTATSYSVVLVVTLGAISMLGIRENVLESRKPKFDIR